MAKVKRQKSSVSARERRTRRAKVARKARREAQLERAARERLDELFAADTPPERAAALWLERLGGDPVPVKVSRLLAVTASEQHARRLAAELERLAPGGALALSLAADVAFQLGGDAARASALIDRALQTTFDAQARVGLADHLLELGRAAEALAVLEQPLLDHPGDDDAQRVCAGALELSYRRLISGEEPAPDACPCWSGRSWSDCCREAEQRALARFGDRERLDGVRAAVRRYTTADPQLHARIADHVGQWLDGAEGFADDADAREALAQAATEHAWLVVGERDGDDDEDSVLASFASSRLAAPADAAAARRWLEHCEYGLWQVSDPKPAPGVWMVELVTCTRRYVAIPPAQLDGSGRWTVLLGALVALDSTWRPTGTLFPLRPTEADGVAELAEELMCRVASVASGREISRRRPGRSREKPAGVLAGLSDPASPAVASFASTVIASGMPQLLTAVGELRSRAPALVNTDQNPLCLIDATITVTDARAVAERLARHPDFERDGEELTWWGRELDELERASAEAEMRALLRERGEDPDAVVASGPRRWLRGRIKPLDDGFEVHVNSRERLERLLKLLREEDVEPVVSRQLVIDPAQDMPQVRVGSLLSLGGSGESQAAWLAHFPDQPLPALGGRTPREAARNERDAPRLEALLRELEHDADILAGRGLPAPDIASLRRELQAPAAAWL
jgi:tetratricopeptide (TPR) repeat protein